MKRVLFVCILAFLGACERPTGAEGEPCTASDVEVPGGTAVKHSCDPGLVCIDYPPCGLNPPFMPCQETECVDCTDPANAEMCADEVAQDAGPDRDAGGASADGGAADGG